MESSSGYNISSFFRHILLSVPLKIAYSMFVPAEDIEMSNEPLGDGSYSTVCNGYVYELLITI